MTNPPDTADSLRGREGHPADARDSLGPAAPAGQPPRTGPRDWRDQTAPHALPHQAAAGGWPDQAAPQTLPPRADPGGSPGQAAPQPQPPQADPRDSPDRACPRAQAHRTSCASPEAASGWLLARGRRSRLTCPRAGRDSPNQCSGLSHEASRWKPRAIRPQKPGLVVLGMAATTWLTVAMGASAMTV